MVPVACSPAADLERLFLGGLPEQEAERLEQHVLECGVCHDTLKKLFSARDTLASALTGNGEKNPFAASPVAAELIGKLKGLRPVDASSQPQEIAMISVACSACHKKFSVKEGLAGKRVKCPSCGQPTTVPALAGVHQPARTDDPTVPLAPVPDLHASSTSPVKTGDALTHPPANNPESTRADDASDDGHDSSFTSFLAPPQADDELGRLGKYRILKILGHGSMGVVYKAEDPKLMRSVAIKAMLPSLVASASAGKRFLREARAMAKIEDDHIVRIYQVDEDRGVPFLAMEFLKGEPLDERLKRDKRLPLTEVLRIGRQIAEGLAAAHAHGLIHRDIKPGNIWLEAPKNRVKILDFGLARAATQDAGLSQQGSIVGTPAYMAPEQGRGETVDARCDLFSLGVVLYRLCTGQQPFHGNDSMSTLLSVATHEPPLPIQLHVNMPQALSDLVMNLLKKDPAARIASADEVVQTLQRIGKKLACQEEAKEKTIGQIYTPPTNVVAAIATQSNVDTVSYDGSTSPKRGRRPVAIAALLLLGVLLGGGALAAIVIFWQTPNGVVRIEIDDPDIKVAFDAGGRVFTGADKQPITLKPGKHGLTITRGDFKFDTTTFELNKDGKTTLKIEWLPGKVQVIQDGKLIGAKPVPNVDLAGAPPPAGTPVDDAWLKMVAALPTDKQVDAVTAKLKERNPGLDVKVLTHAITGGVVTQLTVGGQQLKDVSPVRALIGLKELEIWVPSFSDLSPLKGMNLTRLNCSYTKVVDLTPLKEMKLTTLHCSATKIADLTPLKGMDLTRLNCSDTQVSDLSPLKDMKLDSLSCGNTQVSDLTPLKNMKLTELRCNITKVADLTPLQGMKLTTLICSSSQVSDLRPLKDMNLETLHCGGTHVSDLSPLKGMNLWSLAFNSTKITDLTPLQDMKLETLWCSDTQVSDLSLLKGMPLKEIHCDFRPERDAAILRSIKTLEKINSKPAAQFWAEQTDVVAPLDDAWVKMVVALPAQKQVEAVVAKLKERNPGFDGKVTPTIYGDGVVAALFVYGDKVKDISPVRALIGLRVLDFNGTLVSDLSSLKGINLTILNCAGTKVIDLTPLKDMTKLTNLHCNDTKIADLAPLKDMKLTNLNCNGTNVKDLTPLKDMKLTSLSCGYTEVSDLTPLKNLKLTYLGCTGTKVSDLTPLKDMKLETLRCNGTKVFDLSPLKGMPLKDLHCNFKSERDTEILRSIKTLEKINDKPAAQFWEEASKKQ